jgi:hypothetical protein
MMVFESWKMGEPPFSISLLKADNTTEFISANNDATNIFQL